MMEQKQFINKLREALRMSEEEFLVRTFDQEDNIIYILFTYYGLSTHIQLWEYDNAYRIIISCRDWNTDYDRPIYDGFPEHLSDELVQFVIDKIKNWIEPENVIERLFPLYIKRTVAYISTLADNYF